MHIAELRQALDQGSISSVELTNAIIQKANMAAYVNMFISICTEKALQAAARSDERRRKGTLLSALDGVPFVVKDNFCTNGILTSCASAMLSNFIPPYTADAVTDLEQAGMILLGKTNMDEFAMGFDTTTSFYGPVKNPLDGTRIPGGSSGGSAAAVGAGLLAVALGSDTGGSVREPAACCGCVGLRPTYGAVSRYGLVAYASSMDTVGLLAASVADAEALLPFLQKSSGHDATTARTPAFVPYSCNHIKHLSVRVGVLQHNTYTELAARMLAKHSLQIGTVDLPSLAVLPSVYEVLALSEAATNLARFDGIRFGLHSGNAQTLKTQYHAVRTEGFGRVVQQRILFGSFVQLAENKEKYLLRAMQLRTRVRAEMETIFKQYDVLIMPTMQGKIPFLGASHPICDPYCAIASLCGLPALSLPIGREGDSLPGTVTLCGPAFSEPLLLAMGKLIEKEDRNAL